MFTKLWMVGVQKVPHSNQGTKASIESYHGALKRWLALDALEGVGLIGWCDD